jgi:MYXO-CTERM domain-containing protein
MWSALALAGAASAANIGTNVHLPPADTLDLAVDLGGAWIRIDLNWDLAEPAEGQWNWAPFDTVIDAAKARGLKVYATLAYTPAWASSGNRRGDGANNDVPTGNTYRTYVEAAVARYKTKVDVFSTWNEPNLADFFEGTRDEWIDVVYRPGVLGIRAQCPTCVVAGPEVATIGTEYANYIHAALLAEVPTILSGHIYASFPEDDSAAGVTKDSFYNKLDAHRVQLPFFEGPLSIREAAVAANHPELPVWITETGREADLADAGQLEAQRKQAERLMDAMASRPWWGGTIFYELSEEHPGGMWPNIRWGMVLRTSDPDATPLDDFTRKPVFTYVKQRLASTPPAGDDAGPDAGNGMGNPAGPDGGLGDDAASGAPAGCGCATGSSTGGPAAIAFGVALVLRRRWRLR